MAMQTDLSTPSCILCPLPFFSFRFRCRSKASWTPGHSRPLCTSARPTRRPRSWGTRPSRSCACATSAGRFCRSSTPTTAWPSSESFSIPIDTAHSTSLPSCAHSVESSPSPSFLFFSFLISEPQSCLHMRRAASAKHRLHAHFPCIHQPWDRLSCCCACLSTKLGGSLFSAQATLCWELWCKPDPDCRLLMMLGLETDDLACCFTLPDAGCPGEVDTKPSSNLM